MRILSWDVTKPMLVPRLPDGAHATTTISFNEQSEATETEEIF